MLFWSLIEMYSHACIFINCSCKTHSHVSVQELEELEPSADIKTVSGVDSLGQTKIIH